MPECRSCGTRIVFMATEHGKIMPIDAKPDPDGNVVILAGQRRQTARGELGVVRVFGNQVSLLDPDPEAASADGLRYKSHFATCTHPNDHRRK